MYIYVVRVVLCCVFVYMLALALQSKLKVYLIVEDKIIDYIEYNHSLRQMIVEVARIVTKLDIGSFVLTDPVISLRALLSQYHMYDSMCAYVYL